MALMLLKVTVCASRFRCLFMRLAQMTAGPYAMAGLRIGKILKAIKAPFRIGFTALA
jgi:hypothetical protein